MLSDVTESKHLKAKVCLIGDHAVGKTSLIRRFVQDTFDDRYLMTLGTKVSKKVVDIDWRERQTKVRLDLGIWDIMGQHGLLNLLVEAYFTGANGILAVLDLTRRPTLDTLSIWIRSVERVAGRVPTVIAVNKADLQGQTDFGIEDIERVSREFGSEHVMTSAKTGENVERAFQRLGMLIVQHQLRSD